MDGLQQAAPAPATVPGMPRHPLLDGAVPFTLAQAVAQGLDESTLRQALRRGDLRGAWRGIYVPAELPDTPHTRALALQLAVPFAVVSHEAAAVVWDVDVTEPGEPRPQLLRVTVPLGESRPRHGGVRASAAPLPSGDVWQSQGVRVTSPGRTTADLVRERDLVEAVVAADAMTHCWPRVLRDLPIVASALPPGARGAAVLRAVVGHVEWLSESPMESRLRMVLVLGGLARPVAQHEVRADGRFVARLDLAYPDLRVGVEYDGRAAHPLGLARDRQRGRALLAAGWLVLHFTAEDMREPDRVVREVARALDLQAARRAADPSW